MLRFDPTPHNVWVGLLNWGLIFGAFLLVALIVSYFVAVATVGVKRSGREFWMHLKQGFRELVLVSPRRVLAIAQLVIRESIRRKALLVFGVFALLFMFGSWFISDPGARPEMQATVHITFILKTIAWLSVPVVLLLACWGLPQDIKQRSLHTVVTKPVRRSEVVMGRILGFSAIGTLILVVMAFAGHIWIKRQVPDQAQSLLVSRVPIYGTLDFTDREGNPGEGVNTGDVWEFRSYIEGATAASAVWTFEDITPDQLIEVEDPDTGEVTKALRLEYNFEAFRTHKGRMGRGLFAQFKYMNDLRSQMAWAFWGPSEFQIVSTNIAEGDFEDAGSELGRVASGIETGALDVSDAVHKLLAPQFLNLARMLEPFSGTEELPAGGEMAAAARGAYDASRSGDDSALAMHLTSLGQLMQDHDETLKEVIVDVYAESSPFEVIEYKRRSEKSDPETEEERREEATTTFLVARTLPNSTPGESAAKPTLDLFEDLTHGGRFRVAVYCLDGGQYIGMARPDLYIRTPDRPFEVGYYKAVAGTWLMVILVVVLSVTGSTFVKGPVATLLTVTLILVGLFFHPFLEKLVTDLSGKGFGALESVVRIVQHKNPTVALEDSRGKEIMELTDRVINGGLWTVYKTVPDFNVYSLTPYVANGFDVPFDAGLLPALAMTLAYIFPCLFIGYFSLRLRELEAK